MTDVAAKRAASGRTDGRRGARRPAAKGPTPSETRQSDEGCRFVDVDPWAVLLEQLLELSEEDAPAAHGEGKRR
jgi:hypothetical protein